MTSRNWVKLFMTTSFIGGLTTAVAGLVVRWSEFQSIFVEFKLLQILSVLIWLIVMGFLFSVISQMGFFAYLTVHRFGLGIFKSVSLWNAVQVVLILFVLFDLVYLRYQAFAKSGDSILPYLGVSLFLLVAGVAVAWKKAKDTTREAFIPSLFFMVVVTVIEWVPVLRVNEQSWFYLMLISLLVCNAYQVSILHKLNSQSDSQRRALMEKVSVKQSQSEKTAKKPSL